MPSKSILLLLACYFLGGCVFEDTECEQGSTDPRCPVLDASIDSGTTDGGVDSGRDAMVDAAVDLGPPPCDGGGVRNDAGTCVECTSTANCTNDELCNTTTFECVECLTDAECDDPTKPVCGETGECRGCTADTECSERVGTTVCDERDGQCRQCDPDESNDPSDSSGECGRLACDPTTWTCGTTERGALNFCQTCTADSECKTTSEGTYRCVNITWTVDSGRAGNYCVLAKGSAPCPRQMREEVVARSVTDATERTFCTARRATTTCEALEAERLGASCSGSSPCPTGASCVVGLCASECVVAADCKDPLVCNSVDDAPDYCG